jgi:multisubunit Na+/H+ antiporter MnhB subunit
VILADFRSLDTLVEITVVAVAMIAVVTMLRGRVRG